MYAYFPAIIICFRGTERDGRTSGCWYCTVQTDSTCMRNKFRTAVRWNTVCVFPVFWTQQDFVLSLSWFVSILSYWPPTDTFSFIVATIQVLGVSLSVFRGRINDATGFSKFSIFKLTTSNYTTPLSVVVLEHWSATGGRTWIITLYKYLRKSRRAVKECMCVPVERRDAWSAVLFC